MPQNMSFHFDPETLSEVAEDPVSMQVGINELIKQLEGLKTEQEKALLWVKIGAFQRILNAYKESELSLRNAMGVFQKQNAEKNYWAASLRLAVTMQCQGKIKDAEDIYAGFLKKSESKSKELLASLLDYTYFHWALLKMGQHQYQNALEYLMQAFELRLVKGDMDSISRTQAVIDMVRAKIDNPT